MSPRRYAVAAGKLALYWDDLQIELDGDYLRRHCRCAACRYRVLSTTIETGAAIETAATGAAVAIGETAETPPANVTLSALSPLGYGLQLYFSDGHNRGVFPWSYLWEIAREITATPIAS